MQAKGEGPKKDRSWLMRFVPPAKLETVSIKKNGTVYDTMAKLPGLVHKYKDQARLLAPRLQGKDLVGTCANVFNFLMDHFTYKLDEPGKEQIRTISRLVHDGHGDCDCFVFSSSSLLCNLGIRHFLRVCKYDHSRMFSHIYIVVPRNQSSLEGASGNYLTIDRVAGLNNYEVPFTDKTDITMDIEILNGFPQSVDQREFNSAFENGMDYLQPLTGLGLTRTQAQAQSEAARLGISVEEWKRRNRLEFIKRTGMTPEQWAKQVRDKMAATQAANSKRNAGVIEQLRAELHKRGVVPPPPPTTRATLLKLLNQNPKPKKGLQLAHGVNKFNPLAITLRTGVLLIMKGNLMKIAKGLRWAWMDRGQAFRTRRINKTKHFQLSKVKEMVEKIYYAAGGNKAKLRDAVLGGKGNADRQVPYSAQNLSGLAGPAERGSVREILGDDLYFSEGANMLPDDKGFTGLGLVAAGAAIATASAALASVAAIIKKIGDAKASGGNTAQIIGAALQEAAGGASAISNALDKGQGNNQKVQDAIQKAQHGIQVVQSIVPSMAPNVGADTPDDYEVSPQPKPPANSKAPFANYTPPASSEDQPIPSGENDKKSLGDKVMDNIVPIGIVAVLAIGGVLWGIKGGAKETKAKETDLKGLKKPPALLPKKGLGKLHTTEL